MSSICSFSKTSVLFAVVSGLILIGLAGYFAFKNGVFASECPGCRAASVCARNSLGDGSPQYQRVPLSLLTDNPDYTRVNESFCSGSNTSLSNEEQTGAGSVKKITIAFNNFPEGDTSTQAKYSNIVKKITPNRAGYRCTEKMLSLDVSTENNSKSDRELIKIYRDQIFEAMDKVNSYNQGGVAFITKNEFSSLVNDCYEKINQAGSDENTIKNTPACQYIVNSVIKESMKDKCIGLGES